MTPQELADLFRLQAAEIRDTNLPLLRAAVTTQSQVAQRIFDQGQNSAELRMNYSEKKDMYFDPAKVLGGGKLGKPGKFKNGKPRKTVGPISYKEFKSRLDKPAGGAYVSFELSGDMKSDFTNSAPLGDDRIVEKINNDEYVVRWKRPINIEKSEGLTAHFGGTPIFDKLTATEKKLFNDTLEFELESLLNP